MFCLLIHSCVTCTLPVIFVNYAFLFCLFLHTKKLSFLDSVFDKCGLKGAGRLARSICCIAVSLLFVCVRNVAYTVKPCYNEV